MPFYAFQVVLLIAVTGSLQLCAQDDKIYSVSEVSKRPEPLKGYDHFQTLWSRRGKYPEKALKEGIEGVVFIEFVVDRDGTITDPRVKTGIGYGCDEAALKAFESITKVERWKPGLRRDLPVRVKMVLPFFFRIVKRVRSF